MIALEFLLPHVPFCCGGSPNCPDACYGEAHAWSPRYADADGGLCAECDECCDPDAAYEYQRKLPISRPSRCAKACWTPVSCPECGRDLPPRGRSVPAEWYIAPCCETHRYGRENERHLWDATDSERWRFYPDEEPPMATDG